jgi:hypothetical protein
MKTENAQAEFVVCIDNEGYRASLELRKIYRILPDEMAAKHSLMRVMDESGEDYLYPERFFVPIQLSQAVEEAFCLADRSWLAHYPTLASQCLPIAPF